jgi:peptidoglycan/xylan/chitin deacetylase (PgdA/CDA1 family)
MNLFLAKYPSILKKLYPNRITRLKEDKSLYLTFDDGPVPEITPWVLNELKKHNAKATFFCVGDNIKKNPVIFSQITAHGHGVGNHTYNHLNGWNNKTDYYLANILQTEEIISRQNNLEKSKPKLFRPPYGKIKNSQAKTLVKLEYQIVMWDILSGDFEKRISKEKCLKNVIVNASAGSIIVFHDSIKASRNLKFTLPKVLKYYKEKGFIFKSL